MSEAEYQRGGMDISDQKKMWDGFMKSSAIGGLLTVLLVGFLTFVFAMGMNWAVALGITLIAGVVIGLAMNLGTGWIVTMVGFAILVVIVRILMAIFGALT